MNNEYLHTVQGLVQKALDADTPKRRESIVASMVEILTREREPKTDDGVFDLNIPKGQQGLHVKVANKRDPMVTIDVTDPRNTTEEEGYAYRLTLYSEDGMALGEVGVSDRYSGNMKVNDVFDLVRRPIRFDAKAESARAEG